ncbi:competence/damage-inducible protein A [Clostridium sp. Marseille-P299]|uniref:competence/damage-inducible protein A n=1 Tax=Clostridium sp. Marseille-P299 TaxID=1805477 RepID=UPI00082F8424|nr:competence/damage-inducible protein A [Clostridium sp. Marseille-P299]
MVVELISVGTEILIGNIVNTNAHYLARKCAELGLNLYYQVSVGDNEIRLSETIKTSLSRSDIIILTGGLGPTKDDITKEVLAKVIGKRLVMDDHTKERIADYFTRTGRTNISENNWKQAQIIEGAIILDNENGTAPGLYIETDGKHIFILPGPPSEMIPMVESKVIPILKNLSRDTLVSAMVKVCGIGESMAETLILDLIENQSNPTIAPYAKLGEVHFRITARAKNEEEGRSLINPFIEELKNRFHENIYSLEESKTLEECVVGLLKEKKFTLSAAESCTGGLFLGRLINVSGVSDVIKEGYVTYSEEAKMNLLGVKKETLDQYGVVSEEIAREMAIGAATKANAEVAIGITGIAGPSGGTKENPVGTVCIGCVVKGEVYSKRFVFSGNREKVRELSIISALDMIRRRLLAV